MFLTAALHPIPYKLYDVPSKLGLDGSVVDKNSSSLKGYL
jgi:hypothetical protein